MAGFQALLTKLPHHNLVFLQKILKRIWVKYELKSQSFFIQVQQNVKNELASNASLHYKSNILAPENESSDFHCEASNSHIQRRWTIRLF